MDSASLIGILFVPPLFVAFERLSERIVRLFRGKHEYPAEQPDAGWPPVSGIDLAAPRATCGGVMPKSRRIFPRRARKTLHAELERLNVPEHPPQPMRDQAPKQPQGADETNPDLERIRRMLEAAYT